ncbi:Endothelial zinc finger protein induced by tumor necrosis factor alpha [Folsomia candida]|uniref:Endothelial zinc finger protein induced by tumor necrosis factor alpha n=2 Tax=Folsomia candida TaxID=158441 RepID=A0A226D3M0_FOLCA|nr:Endothelial zinc finger protein induced by tumor necrosis factor alpha [Folsomia candida]
MADQLCLLCLRSFDLEEDTSSANFPPAKIRLATLCQLLRSNYNDKAGYPQFEEDETCQFCSNCYPHVSQVEENRKQIVLLDEEIGRNVNQIRTTILNSSSLSQEDDKVIDIRNILLRLTAVEEEEDENYALDEFQVKLEPEVDHDNDVDPLEDGDFHFDYSSNNHLGLKEEEDDDEDDDSAFCITPCAQNESNVVPKSRRRKGTKRKTPTTLKRKTRPEKRKSDQNVETAPPKRIKQEFPPTLEATRSSSRIKNSTHPLKDVKEKLPTKKPLQKSAPDFQSLNNTKSEDPDWTENNSSTPKNESQGPKKFIARSLPSAHSYPCPVPGCSISSTSSLRRETHLKRSHGGGAHFPCPICAQKFARHYSVAMHMAKSHEKGEKTLACDKCGKKFCHIQNLERHLKFHEIDEYKPLVCHVCDLRFEDDTKLGQHLVVHSSRRYTCSHCGKGFGEKKPLDRHIRLEHTGERPEKCDQCEESFVDKVALTRHVAYVHTETKEHVCHICGKGYHLLNVLKMHLKRHDETRKRACETCGEMFLDMSTLQSHRVKVHNEAPVICDECGKAFGSRNSLRKHKLTHLEVKPHQCSVCQARFGEKRLLDSHMRTHTGERPYPCPHCEIAFKQRKHLAVHVQRFHTPGYVVPIRHPCPHCDKGYPTNCYLQAHIRQVHTGERPFVCDQAGCGKGFAKKTSLYLHLKGHHGLVMEKKRIHVLPKGKRNVIPSVEEKL